MDTDFDIDFEMSPEEEERVLEFTEKFVASQPEVEASDECEGGACKL